MTQVHGQQAAPPVQTPAPSPTASAAVTGILRGRIADQTGALIPGAAVTIANATGATVKSTTADSQGAYSVSGLAAGGYVVQATYQGFAQFISATIQLAAGQSKRVDITMAVEVAQQQVVVTDDAPQPSAPTQAAMRKRHCARRGKDLDACCLDDPG